MGDSFRDYLGDIYVQDSSESGTLGSFCWAPVLYTHPSINVVRPMANDPAHADFGRYTVKPTDLKSIANPKVVPFEHRFPDKYLKLSIGEDLFVVRGKVRPVVVLFNPRAAHQQVIDDKAKSAREVGMCMGCAPSYTLILPNGTTPHSATFVENVRALKYAQFCYLPSHPSLPTDREAFLRLDRLTWIPPELLSPMGLKLNAVGMRYVLASSDWFSKGTALPPELAEVRSFFLELLDEARRSATSSLPDKS